MSFFAATVHAALSSLRVAPLRTALALIGIAIGCAAVVTILQIGLIAERKILESLEEAGINLMTVAPAFSSQEQAEPEGAPASARELETSLDALPGIRKAAFVVNHADEVDFRGEPVFMEILEVTPAFIEVTKPGLEEGTFDILSMTGAPVGIVGSEVTSFMADPIDLGLGDTLRLGQDGYRIGGRLGDVAYTPMISYDLGESLLVPEGSLKRLTAETSSWRVIIEAMPAMSKDLITQNVKALFARDYRLDVDVQHAETIVEAGRSQRRNLTLLLAALGSVALVVGSVGVANVMLASVSERRGEIGLRMAIGASPSEIQLLFLVEAVLLCLIGGMVGAVLGIAGSAIYARLSIADLSLSYGVLAMALGLSTLAGLISGYYPARHSSRLDPVKALQSE